MKTPLWVKIQHLEENVNHNDKQDFVLSVLELIQMNNDVVLGVWQKRDVANIVSKYVDTQDEQDLEEITARVWNRARNEMVDAVNDSEGMQVLIDKYITDVLAEEEL